MPLNSNLDSTSKANNNYPTDAMPVHDSSDIKATLFCFCFRSDISLSVTPIGIKFYMMVHIDPGCGFSLLRTVPPARGPKNHKFWPFKHELVTCSITCQLELNISSKGSAYKCIAWDGSPWDAPKSQICCIFAYFSALSTLKLCNTLTVRHKGILSARHMLPAKELSKNV